MRVFITGGAGLVGGAVAAHLMQQNHEVYLTDLVPQTDIPHTTYATCDIMDVAMLREQMRGCDAVVHLAALRNPLVGLGHDVFRINTAGTFNVFEAAAKEGIKRIVQASSINAIGCAWNIGDFTPHYLPVDEQHPISTTDPYSFSKQQVEEIGAYFWRREGITSVALRLPGVYRAAQHQQHNEWTARLRGVRDFLNDFVTLPAAEQQAQLALVRQRCLAFRAERPLEYPDGRWRVPPIDGINDFLVNAYTFDRYNLWASIDERDAAQAVEKSLTVPLQGAHVLFVNDRYNSIGFSSEMLARLFFPTVTERKSPLFEAESLVSIALARELIGFEPQYSLIGESHA